MRRLCRAGQLDCGPVAAGHGFVKTSLDPLLEAPPKHTNLFRNALSTERLPRQRTRQGGSFNGRDPCCRARVLQCNVMTSAELDAGCAERRGARGISRMTESVLVTGGAGFLGSHLCD